ncbi:MAG: glycosyltransferase [Myxococcales bacterium]|nr:glycosyltransferase [Myxococcales bacterium]MCB9629290.1 glycosyltransferase [Sandaracinaceae bacterium]
MAPVFNEAAILEELAERCVRAGRATHRSFEVLLVDDASNDDTRTAAAGLRPPVRVLHLAANVGQLGATLEGLRAAAGEVCVVLDGDLQDPPEVIPALVDALGPEQDVVFATKRRRHEPAWFRVARFGYGLLLRIPGAAPVPPGAGAFCVMRRDVAEGVVAMNTRWGNLAALVGVLRPRSATLEYDKEARYDGESRAGFYGLVREAFYSLLLTGALAAWAAWGAAALAILCLAAPSVRAAASLGALSALTAAVVLRYWSRKLRARGVIEERGG